MAPGEREHSDPKGHAGPSAATRPVNSGTRERGSDSDRRRRAPFPSAPGEELRSSCARDRSRTACAVEAWRRRECSKEWSLLVMARTCPAYRCRKRLRLRKENGTRACRETSRNRAPQPGGEHRVRCAMVKAVLPESQFPVAKGLAVANAADTLRHAGQIAPASAICHQSARDDHHRWVKETNGTPKHAATSHTRNYGIACSRLFRGPVWRRSRHSTQMPDVMAGTAAARRTIMRIRPGDRTESASDRGKDDAANNGMCSMRREDSSTERFC
ncbi:hypothetical protein ACVWWP_007692 [Bradyrhizobium sp. LM3.6]